MKRKHSSADYFNLGIVLAVTIAMLAGGIYLIVKGISDHNGGAIVGGIFLAVIGAIAPAIVIGSVLQRGIRAAAPGTAPPKISLTVAKPSYVPGDQISGRVDVLESGHVRRLVVSVRRHDRTTSYQDVSWSASSPPLATGAVSAPASYSFSIALPADAVPTYSDATGSIWWDVDARCDVLGSDEHAVQPITVDVQRLHQPETV